MCMLWKASCSQGLQFYLNCSILEAEDLYQLIKFLVEIF